MKFFFVSAILVLLDQATKLYVKGFSFPFLQLSWEGFPLYTSYPLWGDFIRFTYIENAGMAFGIDLGAKLFFSLFSVAASIVIGFYLYRIRNEQWKTTLPLALVLGGAVGNLIDRVFYGVFYNEGELFYGKVVDFIDVEFFDINIFGYQLSRWPVFNIADASVTVGIFFLLIFHRHTSERINETSVAHSPSPPHEKTIHEISEPS